MNSGENRFPQKSDVAPALTVGEEIAVTSKFSWQNMAMAAGGESALIRVVTPDVRSLLWDWVSGV